MIYTGENEITVMLGDMEIPAIYAGDLLIYPTDFGTVTGITLEDLEWVEDVPQSGGTATSANCSFNVYAHYDSGKRRKVNNKSTVTGSLVVPATTAETREYVGVLTLTASYEGFTASDSVDVYQSTDPAMQPLTFEIIGNGNIIWRANNAGLVRTIEYNKNKGGWTTITSTTGGVAIPVVTGDKVEFRGDNDYYCLPTNNSYANSFTNTTCQFNVSGNIMSMINSTDFKNLNTLNYNRQFRNFFYNCTGLTDASNLVLPATSVTQYSYSSMFDTCTSLTAAPALPATTLAVGCYVNMFLRCSNLLQAPDLPATALVSNCYNAMFHSCSKLNYIKCMATSGIGQNNSTYIWVNGVQTVSGTFVKAPSANWSRGTSAVPNNWTIIDAT